VKNYVIDFKHYCDVAPSPMGRNAEYILKTAHRVNRQRERPREVETVVQALMAARSKDDPLAVVTCDARNMNEGGGPQQRSAGCCDHQTCRGCRSPLLNLDHNRIRRLRTGYRAIFY
jgi:hypothetical protein